MKDITPDIERIQETSNPDVQTSIPDGFPPKGQYTAKAIAEALGFDPSGIEKYYLPEALEIYQVCPGQLKAGHLFTQVFYDLVYLFRQHRMRERIVLNSKGQIVRHAPDSSGKLGKPVLEKNPQRMGKEEFRLWYWQKHEELIPQASEDSSESLPEEKVHQPKVEVLNADDYQVEAYDPETSDRMDANLTRVEDMGDGFNAWYGAMVQGSRNIGKQLVADMTSAIREEVEEGMKDFLGAMQTSVTPKKSRTTKQSKASS